MHGLFTLRPRPALQRGTKWGIQRFGLMIKRSISPSDDWVLPSFWIISAILAVISCFSLLLFYVSQPTTYPNPGLAAFIAPPGTRLLPLLRKSDAPELADLPDESLSPLAALAQAQTSQKEVTSKPPAHKRPLLATRENDQRTSDYGPQWNYSYGGWSSNRAWNGSRKMTGGPKSSF